MSHPRVAQSLENKLRKQASLVADVARLQFHASVQSPSTPAFLNGNAQTLENKFEATNLKLTGFSDSEFRNTTHLQTSNDFINEMSPANAFSDVEDFVTTFHSVEPDTEGKNQQSTVASTPLNVVELSLNRSRLMSPPRARSSLATIGNREGYMRDYRSSLLEQHLPKEFESKLKRPTTEHAKTSTDSKVVDSAATSVKDSGSDRPSSPKDKENDLELEALICNPTALDEEWKRIVYNGENATNLAQILSWYSSKFARIYNNGISVCKAFHLVASSMSGGTKHQIPRRAFKRLLTAIICINRSSNVFSLIAPVSNGSPRITFEMFCSVVSKLGSKMDRKRCLFEYQSIRTKGDHLHIDEFNLWLVNSKVLKLELQSDRPSSARSTASQQQPLQAANTVTSELSFGNHLSTKKFSIGVIPIKNKIDRLTHDKGPDFFRSALKSNIETQQMHKDERLRKVAKVAHDRRLRSQPEDSTTSKLHVNKTDYASARKISGVARPSFEKMYEFIDSSLESKLVQMVNDAVRSRMEANGQFFASSNEQQRAKIDPVESHVSTGTTLPHHFVSMSPAPQPSPLMHVRPLEYPSPTPQLSDISSFENSPEKNSPSRFANVGLGWQDSMGLPINMFTEDSPITRALKKITDHLDPLNASANEPLLQEFEAFETRRQQPSDEYSQMIETTLAELSPSVSPRHQHDATKSRLARIQNPIHSAANLKTTSHSASHSKLCVEDLSLEQNVIFYDDADAQISNVSMQSVLKGSTVVLQPFDSGADTEMPNRSGIVVAAVLPDPFQMLPDESKLHTQPRNRFNLFETVQEIEADATLSKQQTSNYVHVHHLKTKSQRGGRDAAGENDMSEHTNASQYLLSADHIQIPECINLEDDFIQATTWEMNPQAATQDIQVQHIDYATTPKTHENLSPVNIQNASPASIAGETRRHTHQKSELDDSVSNMSDRISMRKQEVTVLEKGIDSIRGISELLEMYTSIPSANKKYSPKYDAAGQTKTKVVLPWEVGSEELSAKVGLNHQQLSAAEHSLESRQQSIIEADPSILPEIADSPRPRLQTLNVVANILRDTLPIEGLGLSQNDSEIDEGAISGDESEEYCKDDSEDVFDA